MCQPQVGAGLPYPPVRGPLWLLKRGPGAIQGVQELKSSSWWLCHLLEAGGRLGWTGGRVQGLASLGTSGRRVTVGCGRWVVTAFLPRGPLHVYSCRQCGHPPSGGVGPLLRAACSTARRATITSYESDANSYEYEPKSDESETTRYDLYGLIMIP